MTADARRVIVEWDAERERWHVTWPNGTIVGWAGEDAKSIARVVVRDIEQQDRRRARRAEAKGEPAVVATEIEWRNVPPGFKPPA